MSERLGRLQRLARLFAELADAGNDVEVERALDLCLGFADRIIHERNIEEALAQLLREPEQIAGNPLQLLN
jgi:hypothetical protein